MSIFPRARGPTAILRMYMSGSVTSEPGSPTAIIDIAPLPPRATMPRPSSGSSARSTCRPPSPTTVPCASEPSSSPPITTRPSIGSSSSVRAMPDGRRLLGGLLRRRGRASAPPRAPRARSRARTTRRCTARAASTSSSLDAAARPSRSHGLQPRPRSPSTSSITAPIGVLDVRVLDHRVRRLPRALDDVVLQPPDVVEPLEVLRHRPERLRTTRRGSRSAPRARPRPRSRARSARRSRRRWPRRACPGRGARPRAPSTSPPGARARSTPRRR